MSVDSTVQTFAGLTNENEFYGHHYLAEVFQGDIKTLIEQWNAVEETASTPEEKAAPAPAPPPRWTGGKWFTSVSGLARLKDPAERLRAHAALHQPLLEALGMAGSPAQIQLHPGMPVRVWSVSVKSTRPRACSPSPPSIPMPTRRPTRLDIRLRRVHYDGLECEPRWPIRPGLGHPSPIPSLVPTSRRATSSWSGSRVAVAGPLQVAQQPRPALRLDRDPRPQGTLHPAGRGGAAAPGQPGPSAGRQPAGEPGRERPQARLRRERGPEIRDPRGHRAARQRGGAAAAPAGGGAKKGFFSGKDELDPEQFSLECLRLVYRLLFMFYIEARPELGYVPIRKSEMYLKGYSLESLRDLELTPLNTDQARDGLLLRSTPCAGCSRWWRRAAAWPASNAPDRRL